jgi:hypothetical protein
LKGGGVAAARGQWPGFDGAANEVFRSSARSGLGQRFLDRLGQELLRARGTPCPLGSPALVTPAYGAELLAFVGSYHRAVEAIVRAQRHDHEVRTVLALPEPLREDTEPGCEPDDDRIHLCRVDIMPDPDGGFNAIETNANCPGALLSSGVAGRRWREHLAGAQLDLPDPLDHERPNWMARWFLGTARSETGSRPDFVVLFRQEGGNRLELPGFLEELRNVGVDAIEADPRELTISACGNPLVRGREVFHGYLKLGIRELERMRSELDPFMKVIRNRRLFVQNGLRGRLIGDNKLCLAVLSDPRFAYLFEPGDLEALRDHIPWSRNVALISRRKLGEVLAERDRFVLKRALDTRGHGVVMGAEVSGTSEWELRVEEAARDHWLVQEACRAAEIPDQLGADRSCRHDVSVGIVNGQPVGVFTRSSTELRVNVARSGRLHPVFVSTS